MRTNVSFDSAGLQIAGHLYTPDDNYTGPRPAIVVGHPGSGVKEQAAGLYARHLSEQGFVQQMQAQNMPNASKMARVGDYHTPAGGTMVYYALDGVNQSVGYIVYVGQNGKVLRIE